MDRKRWEDLIRESEQRINQKEIREKRLFRKFVSTLRKVMTVEVLIGIIAAFSMYHKFGIEELEKTLLSWIIGITLAATMVTFMIDRYKKITHAR